MSSHSWPETNEKLGQRFRLHYDGVQDTVRDQNHHCVFTPTCIQNSLDAWNTNPPFWLCVTHNTTTLWVSTMCVWEAHGEPSGDWSQQSFAGLVFGELSSHTAVTAVSARHYIVHVVTWLPTCCNYNYHVSSLSVMCRFLTSHLLAGIVLLSYTAHTLFAFHGAVTLSCLILL